MLMNGRGDRWKTIYKDYIYNLLSLPYRIFRYMEEGNDRRLYIIIA